MTDDNIIRVPRIVRTGPLSMISIWPADAAGVATAVFHSLARKVRPDLTAEERGRLEKYGSIDFKSAGATRKR
jgi:hypothetical protein